MRDLAPEIHRQRLVIEGVPRTAIDDSGIRDYLAKMSETLQMSVLQDPVTNLSSQYGWAGWVHWENSGAHFYAWERPRLFFSVDIYTCKHFSVADALAMTADFFGVSELEHKEF